jgi:hypothetical protein
MSGGARGVLRVTGVSKSSWTQLTYFGLEACRPWHYRCTRTKGVSLALVVIDPSTNSEAVGRC